MKSVLVTDIGDDMDDAFALCYALNCRALHVAGIVVTHGSLSKRWALVSKLLQQLGRTCPIAFGQELEGTGDEQRFSASSFIEGHQVSQGQMQGAADVQLILQVQPEAIICLAPMGVLARVANEAPEFARRTKVFAMGGSFNSGYNSRRGAHAEYNVREDTESARAVLHAYAHVTLAPLDVCASVRVTGRRWKQFLNSNHVLLPLYRQWLQFRADHDISEYDMRSSVLYDVVAVYLATGAAKHINCQLLNVDIIGSKTTQVTTPQGVSVTVATSWKNLAAFVQSLVTILTR